LKNKNYTLLSTFSGISIASLPMQWLVCLFFFFLTGSCKKYQTEKLSSIQSNQLLGSRADGHTNIILFIADDFGYELPTFTGGESYITPNLDSMAANGINTRY
jgi:hypothetical protein